MVFDGTSRTSSAQSQDKEGYGRFCIARRKLVCIFEESTVLRSKQPSQREIAIVLFNQASNKCDEVAKHKTSERNTRRLLEKVNRFFYVRCFSKKLSLSCGKAKTMRPHSERSLRVRRLIASPRKA